MKEPVIIEYVGVHQTIKSLKENFLKRPPNANDTVLLCFKLKKLCQQTTKEIEKVKRCLNCV